MAIHIYILVVCTFSACKKKISIQAEHYKMVRKG